MQQLTKQKPYFVTAGRKNLSTGKNLCQNQADQNQAGLRGAGQDKKRTVEKSQRWIIIQ